MYNHDQKITVRNCNTLLMTHILDDKYPVKAYRLERHWLKFVHWVNWEERMNDTQNLNESNEADDTGVYIFWGFCFSSSSSSLQTISPMEWNSRVMEFITHLDRNKSVNRDKSVRRGYTIDNRAFVTITLKLVR